jgi:hypothetical protein
MEGQGGGEAQGVADQKTIIKQNKKTITPSSNLVTMA